MQRVIARIERMIFPCREKFRILSQRADTAIAELIEAINCSDMNKIDFSGARDGLQKTIDSVLAMPGIERRKHPRGKAYDRSKSIP